MVFFKTPAEQRRLHEKSREQKRREARVRTWKKSDEYKRHVTSLYEVVRGFSENPDYPDDFRERCRKIWEEFEKKQK